VAKVKKLVLDTAEHHPYHKHWLEMAKSLAEQVGAELEVKVEDYVYAIEHGVTDEFGMAGLPQLMAELEDGRVVPLLHEVPLDASLNPDFERAKQLVLEKLSKL